MIWERISGLYCLYLSRCPICSYEQGHWFLHSEKIHPLPGSALDKQQSTFCYINQKVPGSTGQDCRGRSEQLWLWRQEWPSEMGVQEWDAAGTQRPAVLHWSKSRWHYRTLQDYRSKQPTDNPRHIQRCLFQDIQRYSWYSSNWTSLNWKLPATNTVGLLLIPVSNNNNLFLCPPVLYTIEGNAFGKPCTFPFLYKDRWFGECTTYDSSAKRSWCAIGTRYEQEQWGYCPTTCEHFKCMIRQNKTLNCNEVQQWSVRKEKKKALIFLYCIWQPLTIGKETLQLGLITRLTCSRCWHGLKLTPAVDSRTALCSVSLIPTNRPISQVRWHLEDIYVYSRSNIWNQKWRS